MSQLKIIGPAVIFAVLHVLIGSCSFTATAASTDVISPVVSYQYFDSASNPPGQPNVVSAVVSYQFFDWAGDVVPNSYASRAVSYFYQIRTAPTSILVHGSITEVGGAGIPDATVTASVGLTLVAQVSTDGGGAYSLPLLQPGVYSLNVSATGYASSARVITLNASTARQNFQLAPLPAAPPVTKTTRQPPLSFTQLPVGSLGSRLKIFDGTRFVAIDAQNAPSPDRMTIVVTHGWVPSIVLDPTILSTFFDLWPLTMAAQLRGNGVTTSIANIVAWDWRYAAMGFFPPEENAPAQGVALGLALQTTLGTTYSHPIHFLGHSLGTLVNAAAANYLHGDTTAKQLVSSTPWSPARTHVTLFDQAELSRIASAQVLFDGLNLNLADAIGVLKYAANTLRGWKPAMPIRAAWADNYISLVGFHLPNTVNIALQKAEGIAALRAASESSDPVVIAAKTLEYAHSYAMTWYDLSIVNTTDPLNPLGFMRSYEYSQLPGVNLTFPPSEADFPLGDAYHQRPSSPDELALEPLPPEDLFQVIVPLFGNGADVIVQGAVGAVQVVGNVAADIKNAAQQADQLISQGFDYIGNLAAQGVDSVVNLFSSGALHLRMSTESSSLTQLLGGGSPRTLGKQGGNSTTNTPAMAWVPMQIPSNAAAMAFDFIVAGDPADDALVFGIGDTNLFTLQAKYIPTNTISASRLIDVSIWAGSTNELFFGLMGGTSTNCTLEVDNIRFYSLQLPRLDIQTAGGELVLTWPATAGGYVVETTPTLSSATWQNVTNAPAISYDHYTLTNAWPDQTRFFRLRTR